MNDRTKTMNSSSIVTFPQPGPNGAGDQFATYPITPERFWAVFSENLHAEWKDPARNAPTHFNSNTAWTLYITRFLKELSGKFGCKSDTDFWPGIDVGYFDRIGAEWDEWALEAAVENENDLSWHDKLSRLLMVNAGLKVLIAYSANVEKVVGLLNRFVEIHQSRKYLHPGTQWLFIFGPRIYPAKHDFLAFKFDGRQIADITGSRKVIF